MAATLHERKRVPYEELCADVLDLPLFWDKDLKDLLLKLRAAGRLSIEGMKPKERTPKDGHIIVVAD